MVEDEVQKRQQPKTFRLTPVAAELLDRISREWGLSRASVLEMALRCLGQRLGEEVKDEEDA